MSDIEIPADFVIDYTDTVQRYLALCDLLLNSVRHRETYAVSGPVFGAELARIMAGRGDNTAVDEEAMRLVRSQILQEPIRTPLRQLHIQSQQTTQRRCPYPNIRAMIYRTQLLQREQRAQLSSSGSRVVSVSQVLRNGFGNIANLGNRIPEGEASSAVIRPKHPLQLYRRDI